MQDPITLDSGAELVVTIASFKEGNHLLKTLARELKGVDLEMDLSPDTFKNIGDKDVNSLKNLVLQLLQSEAVEAAVMACAKRCLYNQQRITDQTFEPVEARPDFLPVVWEVMKANLRPFFSGLASLFSKSESPPSPAQKS